MLKVYPAIFHQEDAYWVEFPDLEGCNACGATLAETMEAAQEALGLYLTSLIERGIPLPEPSTLTQCRTADTFASYVTTNLDPYYRNVKAVRKTVSIPAWLADEAEIGRAHV